MIDRIKFATEMANELNMSNFQTLTSVMAEYATAGSVDGVQCGQANMLADVFSALNSTQYSVKTYKDDEGNIISIRNGKVYYNDIGLPDYM